MAPMIQLERSTTRVESTDKNKLEEPEDVVVGRKTEQRRTESPRRLSLKATVQAYDKMHKVIDQHQTYFKLSPAQFIWLRRGSNWRQMLAKIVLAFIGVVIFTNIQANSDGDKNDQYWIRGFFLLLFLYYLSTSILYIISYPLGEIIHEVPVHMAFAILRLLTVFFVVGIIHFYSGLLLEIQLNETNKRDIESTFFRTTRIISMLALIIFILFILVTLLPLCNVGGLDGTRVRRPKAFRKFKNITFGNLIF